MGGGQINTSVLNCNQLLNISKMVELIFAKLVYILGNQIEYYQSGKIS